MNQPEVTMVCVYADCPQFISRMLESYRSQSYQYRKLLVYDNGREPFPENLLMSGEILIRESLGVRPLGNLRNSANSWVGTDLIAHADADDWSHPRRIEEQVRLIQSKEARDKRVTCVGYNDMLFFDSRKYVAATEPHLRKGFDSAVEGHVNEAWYFNNRNPSYCIGSSMMYTRDSWERMRFKDDKTRGEDTFWQREQSRLSVSSIATGDPHMVCAIHEGNGKHYDAELARHASGDRFFAFSRKPEYDSICSERMKL